MPYSSFPFANAIFNIILIFVLSSTDVPYNGPPLILHGNQCRNMSANLGDDVTFYCEIYVGKDDYFTTAFWHFADKDGHMTPVFALGDAGSQIRNEIK